ncbi:MAG: hypothetical protein JST17_08410 [Bacteroidetes bacterium]|nr:hypothetical protein [Bacteroidota bacterium]MBS1930802.1 hypothetical protein [Bacteroidota bacterium]
MYKFNFHKIIFGFLVLSAAGVVHAQNKISVNASVDKSKILIGERIHLLLEASFPSGSAVHFFSVDSIPHFVITMRQKVDTEKMKDRISLKQQLQLTSFDSGHWMISPFVLDKKNKTSSIPVDVVFSDFDPSKDYHDIKGIIEVPAEKNQNWWVLPAIISVLVIGAMIWLLKKKKSPKENSALIKVDAYKEAMQQLQQVQKKTDHVKQYYSTLTDIFRLYIFRKKGVLSLQETTDDLIAQLRRLNLDKELFSQLFQSLQLSDSVKFAKFIPTEQDNKIVFETIKKSIERIENSGTK